LPCALLLPSVLTLLGRLTYRVQEQGQRGHHASVESLGDDDTAA
jgi:hypothetical protein